MARHQAFWVILAGAVPTAFRSPLRDDLVPTLHQLQRTQQNVTLRWFERGRVWDSPEAAQAALIEKRQQSRDRKDDWRPGGSHKDPRARYQLTRDQKRARYKQGFGRPDRPPGDRRPEGQFGKPPGVGRPPGAPPNRPPQDRWRKPKPFGSNRPSWNRPAGRPFRDRPGGDRPRDNRPRDDRPRNDRPRDNRPRDNRPRDDRPRDARKSGGDRPRSDQPRSDRPRSDRPPQHRWPKKPFDRDRDTRGGNRPFKPPGPRGRPQGGSFRPQRPRGPKKPR